LKDGINRINHQIQKMKKLFLSTLAIVLSSFLLIGCVAALGTGSKTVEQKPTVGQQLIDLKKAKDDGAITDSEYQAQKARLLANK
jgi:hypothetical protein